MTNQTGNIHANPFDHAFEMLGKIPEVVTEEVNAEALEKLTRALTRRAQDRGRMVLLRSPRAGFGKTHLLMRLHQRVAHSHEFIPLEPSKGRELGAQSVLDAVLRRFSRILPAGGGLTVLDLLARRILAAGLEPLVKSGEVPSQDRDTALQALQTRPVETFDFHNEEAVTAQWAMANFALLGPRLTAELAERTHAGFRPVAWWVELLFRYSSAPVDQSTRNSSLFETVFSGEQMETDVHEKLVALLNLTGLVTSPVLVLDEVEGFSSNPEAALQVATFLNALHQSCEKLALIISVNGDVWETAFLPRIPCGLKDRLSDIVVDLEPMGKETAIKMLRDRAGEKADVLAEELDFDSGVVYARGVVRCAANAWPDVAGDDEPSDSLQSTGPISLRESIVEQIVDEPNTPPVVHGPAPDVVLPEAEAEVSPTPSPEPAATPEVKTEAVPPQGDPMEPSNAFATAQQTRDTVAEPASAPGVSFEQNTPDLANAPRPFARQTPPQPESQPVFQPKSPTESVNVPPQNVVNSPFSIDASAPAVSPFQPAEPAPQQPQPPVSQTPSTDSPAGQGAASVASPFQQVESQSREVTDNDHEKVEDLLKQFRDRYGRD